MATVSDLLKLPQGLRDGVSTLATSLGGIQLFITPTRECRLLALPRELRDMIWIELVTTYINNPRDSQDHKIGCKPLVDLLGLNRQIKEEIIDVFRTARIFNLCDAQGASTLSGILRGSDLYLTEHGSPNLFAEIGHISLLPHLTPHVHSRGPDIRYLPLRYPGWYLPKSLIMDTQTALKFETVRIRRWHSIHSSSVWDIQLLHERARHLKTLEMPVSFLFDATEVRALRRMRGISLHFAFTEAEVCVVPDPPKRRDESLLVPPITERKWLGEDGEFELVLPAYEGEFATRPRALVPLSRLSNAIRSEVAGSEPPLSNPRGIQKDVPLWVDFSGVEQLPPTDASSIRLSSGWYKYVARDPGVCCLEASVAPQPTSADLFPRKAGSFKLATREWRAMRTSVQCGCSVCLRRSNSVTDYERISFLTRNEHKGCLIKGRRNGFKDPTWLSRLSCKGVPR